MRVSLSSLPSPPKEYILDFPRLDGGLNLWELDYRLDANQSPEMKNLCWLDGALGCRDGQVWLNSDSSRGVGYACYNTLFWDFAIFHIGASLYYATSDKVDELFPSMDLVKLCDGVPENRGTFFRFGDALYYKNSGGYFKITYAEEKSEEEGTEEPAAPGDRVMKAEPVVGYVPTIRINADPTNGAGDEYQPENRISSQKTIWYSAKSGVKVYQIPGEKIQSVDKVIVDEKELPSTDYKVDLEKRTVTFNTAPPESDPFKPNTVKITFTAKNEDAMKSIMDCPYAAVYGGDQNVCVVVGGCPSQPNAYFWSGNHTVMDPAYFPFEQYNLAGDTEDMITGFGKQQNILVIFKENSIGRAGFGTTELSDSGRILLEMPYTAINSRIGCDLPWSIRLIENNLVFCNTEQGVHFIKDSSSAFENNIIGISRNVNGTPQRPGLLELVRSGEVVTGVDDDRRYWVVSRGEAYVWDYHLSGPTDPSWFYYTNINGVSFFRKNEQLFHMDGQGRVTMFRRTFYDYEDAIEKVYRFATQNMGSYDRLKDISSVLFSVRSDTDTKIEIEYLTDYEQRYDLSPILSYSWKLVPRNLAYRFLGVRRFATVARRRPGCRHIRHFAMRLSNNDFASDLSVVSAQIFYKFQGRDR